MSQILTLRVGGYAPVGSVHSDALDRFRSSVLDGTEGRVAVEVIWNIMDSGRANTDLFEMVESGELFMCYFSTSYLGHRVPELDILETPYLFSDLEQAHRALDGALGEVLVEATRRRTGFELLGFWDNGFRHFTNRLRPVRQPADTRGMRVRLQPNPIHEELIRSWGAEPVAVELSRGIELIGSLEVDAQENPLANTVAYGVERVHPFITMTAHLYGARGLFANRAAVEALPTDVEDVVRSAVGAAIAYQRVAAEAKEQSLRRDLEQAGLAFEDLTDEERAQFVRASSPAIEVARRRLGEDLFAIALG